ncbi:hypothetical protein, partial [Salinibacter ruber]|uniref:hypothetical protein n=1 Tax=Salinibacter ruber TaxID=146919 RepID=UPI0020743289
ATLQGEEGKPLQSDAAVGLHRRVSEALILRQSLDYLHDLFVFFPIWGILSEPPVPSSGRGASPHTRPEAFL